MNVATEARFDSAQAAALAHPLTGGPLALVGGAGTGKTTTLVARAVRLARAKSTPVLLTSPSEAGVARLRALLRDEAPFAGAIVCATFGDVAFDLLDEDRAARGRPPVERIDDVRASQHFERVGAALFALEWSEFALAKLDPEITGLRTPERFSAAAFRLIRKLRASLISPDDFKSAGLRGATAFYGRPPNLANTGLLLETAPKYRDSLRVTPEELERQRRREVDLVKILARLYATYLEALVAHGCMTPTDAVYEAVRGRHAPVRERFSAALVDDAQDANAGQLGLLASLFGDALAGVTLAGDEAQSTRAFAAGGRGGEVFKLAETTIVFDTPYRCDPAIARAARSGLDPATGGERDTGASAAVQLYRGDSTRDEARFVTGEIISLLAAGMPAERIAIVTRNLGCVHAYVDALLARNIPVDVAGTASFYEYPIVTDALAALWSAVDPFRHDFLLRNLEAPWLHLSDASIAALCADAAEPQTLLFDVTKEDENDDEARAARWDRKRDIRLGRNVTRGDADLELTVDARERIGAFRAARNRWETLARTHPLPERARIILAESVVATFAHDARGRFEGGLIERLLDDVDAFAARDPLATLDDFLAYAERTANAEADLLVVALRDATAVRVLDVEAAKGENFDAVFLVDVQAGAWPRYYVPDAFLFMPSAGVIPKENVGEAGCVRTAKFTYTLFRYKLREKYNAEERRSFYCAASRARKRLYVSASGRPTRGTAAPEIFEELQKSV